jgi:hypothetical protein
MNDVVEPRREKWTDPLVIGGTPVDDAIMDLIEISEMAEDDPVALQIMNELVELINAELSRLRSGGNGHRKG